MSSLGRRLQRLEAIKVSGSDLWIETLTDTELEALAAGGPDDLSTLTDKELESIIHTGRYPARQDRRGMR